MVFLNEFLEKVDFEKKISRCQKLMKKIPACKELKISLPKGKLTYGMSRTKPNAIIISLISQLNKCCGYSKELSH